MFNPVGLIRANDPGINATMHLHGGRCQVGGLEHAPRPGRLGSAWYLGQRQQTQPTFLDVLELIT